ncbi:hypothetical protein QZH41_001647 [Actinostola sp. cb2023]|nr:hypothetical protein QZH41_001647 [Actinostola sp. cb2023]
MPLVMYYQWKRFVPPYQHANTIPYTIRKKELSIVELCPNVESCATEDYPYGLSVGLGDKFTEACTKDHKCNLEKAIPMMAGMFWFKFSDWIAERMCPEKCLNKQCNFVDTYEKVIHESKLLMGFVNIFPTYWTSTWTSFFQDAVDNKAYLYLNQALAMVEDKEQVFYTTPVACSDLAFTKACPYADIYKEFIMIKKIQKYRQDPGCIVRDLRQLPNVDFKTRLKREKDTLRHIELLGAIKAVDANLQVSVSGISEYFQGIAKYDEGIAEADILFIKGELDKYEAGLTTVETQIKDDIHEIMKKMIGMLAANLGEAIVMLVAKIAENSNPLNSEAHLQWS